MCVHFIVCICVCTLSFMPFRRSCSLVFFLATRLSSKGAWTDMRLESFWTLDMCFGGVWVVFGGWVVSGSSEDTLTRAITRGEVVSSVWKRTFYDGHSGTLSCGFYRVLRCICIDNVDSCRINAPGLELVLFMFAISAMTVAASDMPRTMFWRYHTASTCIQFHIRFEQCTEIPLPIRP
jgi:hypothetical protein